MESMVFILRQAYLWMAPLFSHRNARSGYYANMTKKDPRQSAGLEYPGRKENITKARNTINFQNKHYHGSGTTTSPSLYWFAGLNTLYAYSGNGSK